MIVRYMWWGLLLTLLNVIDWVCTFVVLSSGGIELMPVADYIIFNYGFSAFLVCKVAFCVAMTIVCYISNALNIIKTTCLVVAVVDMFMAAQALICLFIE